jgi:PhnB protein
MSTTNNNPIIEPYLFFDGRCEEAVQFYQKALGAKLNMLMRYKESPEGGCPAGSENKVMHASLEIGGRTLMAADDCTGKPVFGGFSLSLRVKTPEEAQTFFSALADGAQVKMPLTKTFFSPSFGMLTDRFGVGWIIMAQA